MKLHLLRHAKTNQSSPTDRDFDRTLLPRGIAQCADLNIALPNDILDAEVWCSGSARTRETYDLVAKGGKLKSAVFRDDLYLASRAELLKIVCSYRGSSNLLIIGHNYGISNFASYLLDESVELQTAGYICISFTAFSWAEISAGTGIKVQAYRPDAR